LLLPAELYGVETKRLKEQVQRNIERFPPDFMLQLTKEEFDSLRSQIVTSKGKGGGGIFLMFLPGKGWLIKNMRDLTFAQFIE